MSNCHRLAAFGSNSTFAIHTAVCDAGMLVGVTVTVVEPAANTAVDTVYCVAPGVWLNTTFVVAGNFVVRSPATTKVEPVLLVTAVSAYPTFITALLGPVPAAKERLVVNASIVSSVPVKIKFCPLYAFAMMPLAMPYLSKNMREYPPILRGVPRWNRFHNPSVHSRDSNTVPSRLTPGASPSV